MTNDETLWDWGPQGDPEEARQKRMAEEQSRKAERYAVEKALADRKQTVKDAQSTRYSDRDEAVKSSIIQDQSATHIWFGFIDSNIRNHTKAITGKCLPPTHYVRLAKSASHLTKIMTASMGIALDMKKFNEAITHIAAVRLTKQQALQAKLSTANAQVIVDDEDGAFWKKLTGLANAIENNQDMTFHSDALTSFVKIFTELFRKLAM